MDNLWGYGEDEPSSSSCLGPSSQERPSSSAGSASPLTTQAAVMAGRPSSVVPVMSGPVPPVSARSGSSLPGSQDSVPPSRGNHDDLPPPPPPAEPYEVFLACVRRDLSNSSGSATQPDAAARPRASVTTTTPGNRFPTPFPTYEDSSWTLQSQVQASRIRMPLPASFYAAPPSPWVWPGRGSPVTTSVVRAYKPATPPAALAGLPGPTGSFPGGPTPVPPPAIPALPDSEMHSPTVFFGCHAPFCPASREPCTTVRPRSHLCGSHGDATRCCEHFTGPFPEHDQELEGGVHAGDEN